MSAICSLTGAVAGAAAPMTTPGTNCGPTAGVLSADNSGLLPPLRAESAAKGETWPERVAGSAALRRLWVIGRAADGVPDRMAEASRLPQPWPLLHCGESAPAGARNGSDYGLH